MIARRYQLGPKVTGSASAFDAVDQETGRSVRIEAYPRAASDAGSSTRLAAALAGCAAVDHAGMVRPLRYRAAAGRCYVVTEAPMGEALCSARTDVGDEWALAVLCDVADVLSAAHHHGIAHGDLGPSDVHVTSDGVAQITGFGRATVAGMVVTPVDDVQAFSGLIRGIAAGSPGLAARVAPLLDAIDAGRGPSTARGIAVALAGTTQPSARNAATSRAGAFPERRGLIASLPMGGRILLALLVLGTTLSVVWASGTMGTEDPRAVAVPDLTGIGQDTAEAQLLDLGLRGRFERQTSADVPMGQVLSQEPAAGTLAAEDHAVTLVVSSGGVATEVPELVGLRADEAEARLRAAGLHVRHYTGSAEATSTDVVTSQAPAAGDPARQGEAVTIFLGPAQ